MKNLFQWLSVTPVMGMLAGGIVRAEDKAIAGKEAKAKPYPLDHCLISGEKFEGSDMKPFEMVYEGQTIKFCCKNCEKDFKKAPKKELAKLAAEVKKQKTKTTN